MQGNTLASQLGEYMQKTTIKFQELTSIESAWTYSNQGKLVFFSTPDHISIAHPTEAAAMLVRQVEGKDYKFGKVVQAGATNGIINLNEAWSSKKFPKIKTYLYLGE